MNRYTTQKSESLTVYIMMAVIALGSFKLMFICLAATPAQVGMHSEVVMRAGK